MLLLVLLLPRLRCRRRRHRRRRRLLRRQLEEEEDKGAVCVYFRKVTGSEKFGRKQTPSCTMILHDDSPCLPPLPRSIEETLSCLHTVTKVRHRSFNETRFLHHFAARCFNNFFFSSSSSSWHLLRIMSRVFYSACHVLVYHCCVCL